MVHWWNTYKSWRVRTVQCNLYECWCTTCLLIPRLWWPEGHFDRFVIFYGFIVSLSMFWSHLFGVRVRVSQQLVPASVVNAHVIRVGEARPKCWGLDRSPIFSALELLNTIYITLKSPTLEIYVSPFVWGRCSAACMSAGAPQALLYLVFGGHEVILIASWFFLDSYYQYQCSDLIYLEGNCAWVHTRCGLVLSLRMSFVFVRPAQSVEIWIDLQFFGLLSFWILYRLYTSVPLVEYVETRLFKRTRLLRMSIRTAPHSERESFFGHWWSTLSILWLGIVHHAVWYVEMADTGRWCAVWKCS